MRVGMEFEALFHRSLEVNAIGDISYSGLRPVLKHGTTTNTEYWAIKTDSSIGSRPAPGYKARRPVQEYFSDYYNIGFGQKLGFVSHNSYIASLYDRVVAELRREHGWEAAQGLFSASDDSVIIGANEAIETDFSSMDIRQDQDYVAYEIVSVDSRKRFNRESHEQVSFAPPIHIDAVPRALEEFSRHILNLENNDDEDLFNERHLWKKMFVNQSCGLHLRVGDPIRSQRSAADLLNGRPLYKLKYRMLRWIEKEEGVLAAWMFASHLRRGGYAGPIHQNIILPANSDRTEISLNKGLEWRAFHIVGVKDWDTIQRRIMKGIDLLVDAYEQCMHVTVYPVFRDIKSKKFVLELEIADV